MSTLHRNSGTRKPCFGFNMRHIMGTEVPPGTLTRYPSSIRLAERGTLLVDRERFTQARYSCLEPDRSVGKELVGELSLSGKPECLSLQESILPELLKTGKCLGRRYPGAQAPDKVGPPCPLWGFLPMAEARGFLGRVGEVHSADVIFDWHTQDSLSTCITNDLYICMRLC